jgi:hypothetical protein
LRKPAGALSFDNNREWYFVNMIEWSTESIIQSWGIEDSAVL